MGEKYHCPNCGRCYVDWGAKKLKYRCPTEDCNQAPLILVGADHLPMAAKPKTKRSKKTVLPVANPEDHILELDSMNSLVDDNGFIEGSNDDLDDDDDNDDEQESLEAENSDFSQQQQPVTERSLPMGDTKGKKEKDKAQKQKAAKDTSSAKKKKDKAPKSKAT